MKHNLLQSALIIPALGIMGAHPVRRSTLPSVVPESLVADAPIWGSNGGYKGYAFLPVEVQGHAGTLVITLEDEGDVALSTAALARLGVTLADNTTQLDAMTVGSVIEHHVPIRTIKKSDWTVQGPPTLPPVIGLVGGHFLTTHYDLLYDFPGHRVRLYAMPAHPVSPSAAWLPPGVKPSDCGKMVHIPSGSSTFTGMALELDGHPVTGVLEMGPYQEKMNQAALNALHLPAGSPRLHEIPPGRLPPGYSHNGYTIKQEVDSLHMKVGQHTFWVGPVQLFPVLDVESQLGTKTPVMLMNLSTIRGVMLFNSTSSRQVCISTP